MLRRLFSNGLSFITLPFRKQWAESERLLQLVDTAELEATLTKAVGGSEFLSELREAHRAYGQVLNVTEAAVSAVEVNLMDRLLELRSAIANYVVQIVAWSLTPDADPEAARSAVHPIDVVRAIEARRRRVTSAQVVSPTADVPPTTDEAPSPDAPTEEALPEVTPETPVPNVP